MRIDGRSDDIIMLSLLKAHSVPILTYAIETVTVTNCDENQSPRVAYKSIFRKLFGYCYSESVTALQGFLGRLTWEQLVEGRKGKFRHRILNGSQDTLAFALMQ